MPRPSPSAHALAERYRVALLEPPSRGVIGARLGRGTGASLEFQDRRAYAPGDDVRHLDWRAFARTDQLVVRQYREEILPRLDLVLDASRSMALHAEKLQCALDVAALIAFAARADGLAVNVVRAGERLERVELDRFERDELTFDGREPLDTAFAGLGALLRPGALRIVVSDFLFPHDPRALVRSLGARGGGLALVQVLAREEREPDFASALRLTDCETDATLDQVVDRGAVERYQARLERLVSALDDECRRAGARFASLTAETELDELCRDALVPAQILVPA